MNKKILFVALAVLCVLPLAGCKGKGPKANPPTDFQYEMTEDGAGIKITRYVGKSNKIVVPENIEGMPVLEIERLADWNAKQGNFKYNDTIEYLSIPETVRRLGTTVDTYDGVIYFPIDTRMRNLATLKLPAHDYKGGLDIQSDVITEIVIPEGRTVSSDVFRGCKALKKISYPSTIGVIDGNISQNKLLNEIVIPENVTSVKFLKEPFVPDTESSQFTDNALTIKCQQQLKSLGYKGKF